MVVAGVPAWRDVMVVPDIVHDMNARRTEAVGMCERKLQLVF